MSGPDRISNPAKLQLSFLPVTGTGSLGEVNKSLFSFFQRRSVYLEAREPYVPNRFHAHGTDEVYRLVWSASNRFGLKLIEQFLSAPQPASAAGRA